jgi:regulation of enolase protein 1 (concanavalin A-like superfamily)
MTGKIEIDFDNRCFVIDGVRISDGVMSAIVNPKPEIWMRFERTGDVVVVTTKVDERLVELMK